MLYGLDRISRNYYIERQHPNTLDALFKALFKDLSALFITH